MADVEAGLSVGQLSLRALLELKSETTALHDTMRKLLKAQSQYQARGPVSVQLRATGQSDAAGDDFYLDLGGPSYGMRWEVRQLLIGGATFDSAVLGGAQILNSAAVPPQGIINTNQDPPIFDLIDWVSSLPYKTFYSAAQFVVRHPQHVFVFLDGPLTASVTYAAKGYAVAMPDTAADTTVSV